MSHYPALARGPRAYRRGVPRCEPSGKIILIVTEGKKTEPVYLGALRRRFNLAATDIVIVHPNGTDPLTLTLKAIELRDERKKQAKKGTTVAYDEVWVVFDLERTHDERRTLAVKAQALPEAKGISFALSDPCFEYWLLLHEEYTTALFEDCAAVMKRLKKHWKGYTKEQEPAPEFLNKLPAAVKNAMRCRAYHLAGGGNNPSTDVDLLVRSLNGATRKHLQYDLTSK
jgi:hypothetical protein